MAESRPGWHVAGTGLVERVPPDDMRTFMQVCPERPYTRGGYVFHAGDPASHLHVVAKGRVKLVAPTADGRERILAVCGPGDFFGEAFVDDGDVVDGAGVGARRGGGGRWHAGAYRGV